MNQNWISMKSNQIQNRNKERRQKRNDVEKICVYVSKEVNSKSENKKQGLHTVSGKGVRILDKNKFRFQDVETFKTILFFDLTIFTSSTLQWVSKSTRM